MLKSQWRSTIKTFNDKAVVPENEWQVNTEANIDRLNKSNSIWTMENMLVAPNDKAVVIVGASPCLKRDVEKLKQCNREDFLIICVNSALKFLLEHDVKPDYIVALDSDHDDIFDHLDVDSKDLHLLASNVVSPKILDKWEGEITYIPYFSVSEDLKRKLRYRLGKSVPIGGNALGTMVAVAIEVWRARIIILVASECCYEEDYYPSKDIARNNGPCAEFYVNDYNGDRKFTTTALHTYKLWLERLALECSPHIKIIDTSYGILGTNKSYIYVYALEEIVKRVKDAIERKRGILKDAENYMSSTSLHTQSE